MQGPNPTKPANYTGSYIAEYVEYYYWYNEERSN